MSLPGYDSWLESEYQRRADREAQLDAAEEAAREAIEHDPELIDEAVSDRAGGSHNDEWRSALQAVAVNGRTELIVKFIETAIEEEAARRVQVGL